MAKNYKNFRAFRKLTRKLVFPIAIVLLPGGLVLLAFHWVRKFAADAKAASARAAGNRATEPATPGDFRTFMRLLDKTGARAEMHCPCIRRGSKRRLPAARLPDALTTIDKNKSPAHAASGAPAEAFS